MKKWLHTQFSDLKNFGWQDGYGAFTVSKSKAANVVEYIKNQREHHKNEDFENEYLKLMKFHEIDFDEKYLFD
jgi:putative transposase